jgi:hypothetical protein
LDFIDMNTAQDFNTVVPGVTWALGKKNNSGAVAFCLLASALNAAKEDPDRLDGIIDVALKAARIMAKRWPHVRSEIDELLGQKKISHAIHERSLKAEGVIVLRPAVND